MRRAFFHLLLLAVPLMLAGCQLKGAPVGAHAERAASDGVWAARPVSIRVYPTTRFVRQGDAAVLEARVELFDEMGDSVKGSGEFRLELRDAARAGPEASLYTWRVELRTVEDQRTHYDPITRTYLFRLKLDDLSVARRSTLLSASYATPGGQRFTAEAAVKTDW